MDKAIYTAMTGAAANLRAQAAVSNNLANVSTTGFKAELIRTTPFQVQGDGLQTRYDAVLEQPGFDASQGALQNTGNPLDVALHDGVWMAVQDRNGAEAYTRAGELRISQNGLLTTASGLLVQGENGPISVPPGQTYSIGADGTVSLVPQGQTPETLAQVGRLKLVRPGADALQRGPDGLFRTTGAPPPPASGVALTSGAIEGSNVNAATSLVQMIELARQFEMQVKVIKSAEENSRSSASLLRLS